MAACAGPAKSLWAEKAIAVAETATAAAKIDIRTDLFIAVPFWIYLKWLRSAIDTRRDSGFCLLGKASDFFVGIFVIVMD